MDIWCRYFIISVCIFSLFIGCATRYPLGLSEDQWQALSIQQQAEYAAQQYQIDEDRRKKQEEYYLLCERELAEEANAERERVGQIYEDAEYGDIIQVNVWGGRIAFNGKKADFEPVSFDLARGERKRIRFYHHEKHTTYSAYIWVAYENNAFYFDVGDDSAYKHHGERIVILDKGKWEDGKTYRPKTLEKDSDSEAEGIKVFIKYKPLLCKSKKKWHY